MEDNLRQFETKLSCLICAICEYFPVTAVEKHNCFSFVRKTKISLDLFSMKIPISSTGNLSLAISNLLIYLNIHIRSFFAATSNCI